MSVLFEGSVPTFALDTVSERVAKVNKRANRRGFPTVTASIGTARLVSDPYWFDTCAESVARIPGTASTCGHAAPSVEYSDVTITADAPLAMAGWRLIGVIATDATNSDGAIAMVTDVPGESTRGIEVTDAQHCDHCNTNRYRSETFLVRHDDGTVRQVGRQCIRDFLGHDPSAMLAGLDAFRTLEFSTSEREEWGRSAPRTWTVEDVITAAARIVRADGWYVSKQKAIDSENTDRPLISTASRTMGVLNPINKRDREKNDREYPHTDAVDTLVKDTIAALHAINPNTNNEWEYKLSQYAGIETVGSRHLGILASATILGLRAAERAAKVIERAATGPQAVDAYIAPIGTKVANIPATITFTKEFEGNYGTTTIVKFATEQGNAVWFASGSHPEFEAGQTVTLSGTVKGYDTDRFDGSKVTNMTRCKVGR